MLSSAEWEAVRLSVQVAGVAVLISIAPAVWLAHVLARGRVGVATFIDNLLLLPIVLPPVVTGLVLLWVCGPEGPLGSLLLKLTGVRLAFNWVGATIAAAVVSFPLLVQPIRIALEQVDTTLVEAARAYGASRLDTFRYVMLPLAGRGVAAGTILAFARALGEFGATIVFAGNIPGQTRTIPLAIFSSINRVDGDTEALRLVLIAIGLSVSSVIVYAFLSQYLHKS